MSYSILHGDATKLITTIPDASVHLVVTDPPYFIDGMGDGWDKGKLEASAKRASVVGGLPVGMKFDPAQGRQFQAFMAPLSREILRVLKPGGFLVCFSQPRLYHRLGVAVEDAGFEMRDAIVWKRRGQAKAFSQDHFVRKRVKKGLIGQAEGEAILASIGGRKTPQLGSEAEIMTLAQKPKDGTFVDNWIAHGTGLVDVGQRWEGKFPTNVIESKGKGRDGKSADNIHMTVKPVDLIAHLIRLFSAEGQTVLDPFLGSGSHGVAALRAGRDFIGFELNADYFALAQRRIEEAADLAALAHQPVAGDEPAPSDLEDAA